MFAKYRQIYSGKQATQNCSHFETERIDTLDKSYPVRITFINHIKYNKRIDQVKQMIIRTLIYGIKGNK